MFDELTYNVLENSFYGFEGTGYQKHCQQLGKKPKKPLVIVGYDTRFLSKELAYVAANALLANGISVKMADEPMPTPVAEWNVLKEAAVGGIVITGSEADYHVCGLKWIAYYGGIANNEIVEDIEKRTPGPSSQLLKASSTEFNHLNKAVVPTNSLKKEYLAHIEKLLDGKALKKAKLKIALDPLFGTAQYYFRAPLEKCGAVEV